jgi:uncharacterized protein YbjQ (UPF0145 family)
LTTTPYEPSLNAAEKLILRVKLMLRSRQINRKLITLQTIRSVVDQIGTEELERFQRESQREAMERMKKFWF